MVMNPALGKSRALAEQRHDAVLYHRVEIHLQDKERREATLDQARQRLTPLHMESLLKMGLAMLSPDFDSEAWEQIVDKDETLPETFEEVWTAVCGHVVDESGWEFPINLVSCGSARLNGRTEKTPLLQTHDPYAPNEYTAIRAFYRFLYYVKPKQVDLSDMYKTSLCGIVSRDLRFGVILDLFKYEPSLRFYCLRELRNDENAGEGISLETGIVGLDTYHSCTDLVGQLWFHFIHQTMLTPTMVYGGNTFVV